MNNANVFSGVRVLELAQYVFVPGASVMLADQGAEVIKIEVPGAGDPYRTLRIGDGREIGSVNLAMEQNNRGKKSIALDLKSEEGREALLKLVETADVFLTSLRPQALKSLRLDVDDLRARNPKIIYARGNGLGYRGAEAGKPGFDASAFWARGGACYAFTPPGTQPLSPRPAFGDHAGSLSLAYGICGALFKRAMTGEPSVVETSLLATAVWLLSADVTYDQVSSYQVHSKKTGVFPLRRSYLTRDGRGIHLMLLDPRPYWKSLCQVLSLDELIEDPRFVDEKSRMENRDALCAILEERIAEHDWDYWRPLFQDWNAPWELIQTIGDVAVDPQVVANDMMFPMQVGADDIRVVAGPAAFDGQSAPTHPRSSPQLGEHTMDLLTEAGYREEDLQGFKSKGIIQ